MSIQGDDISDSMYDYDFNILFVGDKGVGKTSLIMRLVRHSFTPNLPVTLGISFWESAFVLDGLNIKMRFFDTPGHESVTNFAPNFFRRADIVAIVFDHTNRQSFLNLNKWRDLFNRSAGASSVVCIVATKCDVLDQLVSFDEVSEYAKRNIVQIFETSAMNAIGVEDMKYTMARYLISLRERLEEEEIEGSRMERGRRLSRRHYSGRFCCGGRRRSPSPSPLSPLHVLAEPRVNLPPTAEEESPAVIEDLPGHFLNSMREAESANEHEAGIQLSNFSLEENSNPRPVTDSSGSENTAPIVPPVESALDPGAAKTPTSSTIGDGKEHHPEAS